MNKARKRKSRQITKKESSAKRSAFNIFLDLFMLSAVVVLVWQVVFVEKVYLNARVMKFASAIYGFTGTALIGFQLLGSKRIARFEDWLYFVITTFAIHRMAARLDPKDFAIIWNETYERLRNAHYIPLHISLIGLTVGLIGPIGIMSVPEINTLTTWQVFCLIIPFAIISFLTLCTYLTIARAKFKIKYLSALVGTILLLFSYLLALF